MATLNKYMAIGNLTRDPESRSAGQNQVVSFALAINRKYKDRSGQTGEEVLFIECEAWGATGATLMQYATKGTSLFIEGRLKMDQWSDKNTGEKKSRMKVFIEGFQFVGGKSQQEVQGNARASDDLPDDVPF